MQMMISKGKAKFEFLAVVPGTQMFPCCNTGMYLHENIKADGKIYIVCVGKSSTRSIFCSQVGIAFNKSAAFAGVHSTGVANTTCSGDLNGSLKRRLEKCLHLPFVLPVDKLQLKQTKSRFGEKNPRGFVLKFNSLSEKIRFVKRLVTCLEHG